MKIAFLVSHFPLLSETFILNQIIGLIQLGHTVDIYAYEPGKDPTVHEDVIKYDLLSHTSYCGDIFKNMPSSKIMRLLKRIMLFISHLRENHVPLIRSLNVFKFGRDAVSLTVFCRAIPFMNKGDYDIIHCHFGPNGSLGALLKDLGIFKGKVVTTFHGHDMTHFVKTYGKNVYNHLFKNGDIFLPISERWKNELINLGCDEKRILVHHMGIDLEKYRCQDRRIKNDRKINILSIARLVEKKGIEYGIRAVAKVTKDHPAIEYTIVGDGPLRKRVESLIGELDLEKNVKLLGWKKQEEIITLLKDADIFLAPSVTGSGGDQEGIPVVLMEAMAQELPVVSTYHSGIPELVQDGISGFLVPEKDVDALAERLAYMMDTPEIRDELGRNGRKYVEAHYNIHTLNMRLVEIYRHLLSGDGVPAATTSLAGQ